jgi:hypothetical protein
MENNTNQNTDINQTGNKKIGIVGGLTLFTAFLGILLAIFYGINWLIG